MPLTSTPQDQLPRPFKAAESPVNRDEGAS
jgi:hypothetical protein